jgi:hypothetical protein
MSTTPITFRRTGSDIDQTDAVARATTTSEAGTPLGILLRRRSTLSPNEDKESSTSPKSLSFDDQDDDATEVSGSGDDTTTVDDLETGAPVVSKDISKKKCGKKRIVMIVVWILIVISLVIGLMSAFAGKSNDPAVTSSHENDMPPQQKGDTGFSINVDGKNDKLNDFSDEDDDQAPATSSPKDTPEKPEVLEWPELVGMWGENAKARLEEKYGKDNYDIIIVPENSPVTKDLRWDRIRLFVDKEGKVVSTPRVG